MRFAIATLGCKVNQYDSAIVEARLARLGMERREFGEIADVYIVNTCTVTNRADSDSLRFARRARRLNPNARIVMTGCLAQANPGALASAAEVDCVVGLGRLEDLERAVAGHADRRVMVSNVRKERVPLELAAAALSGHTRAFLKVQEGCDQFCSFCIVPVSRGASRSIEPRRVMAAIDELHARGFKEVVLTGVHLGGYGKDLSPPIGLAALLEMVAERSPIGRVRLSSLDPEELSDRIISVVAQSDKFCPHFHVPLQAGADGILARMRRRYDTAFYRGRAERIVEMIPEAAIGSDLIVGFPGETAGDFDDYIKFVDGLPLAYLHVFPYSVRAGTTAAKLPAKVGPGEIKRRGEVMQRLGESKRRRFAGRFRGAKLKVLLEDRGPGGELRGYSRNYLRVLTRGPDELKNHEVEVEVSLVQGAGVVGAIVPAEATRGDAAGTGNSA